MAREENAWSSIPRELTGDHALSFLAQAIRELMSVGADETVEACQARAVLQLSEARARICRNRDAMIQSLTADEIAFLLGAIEVCLECPGGIATADAKTEMRVDVEMLQTKLWTLKNADKPEYSAGDLGTEGSAT